MIRYNANSRLFKYTTEEKKRYKLYKKKKMWVVAGMSLFSTATFIGNNASADELNTTTVATDDAQSQADDVTASDATLKEEITTESTESSIADTTTENTETAKMDAMPENEGSVTETASAKEVVTPEETTPAADASLEKANTETTVETQPKASSVNEQLKTETKANVTTTVEKIVSDAPQELSNETVTNDAIVSSATPETSTPEEVAEQDQVTPVQAKDITADQANDLSTATNHLHVDSLFRSANVDLTTNEAVSLLADLASTDVKADDNSAGRKIKIVSVTDGSKGRTLSEPKKSADGSTEYIINSRDDSAVGLTISYTGKSGDTFSLFVVPGEGSSGSVGLVNAMKPTGNPKRENKDGGYLFTWTITDVPENATVTRT